VEIMSQDLQKNELVGKIAEVLGHENTPGIEITAAIRAYDLPHIWDEKVTQSIQNIGSEVLPAHKKNRIDLREIPLITIDGEDAKDFDDAVYCEPKPRGGFKLIVAIADVSFYVKPKTDLDKEAQKRGNSVYFPGRVIPMLPEILSNELCSLKPQVDRLCMVCEMHISEKGLITRYEFYEGLMRSHARFTYTKVAAILANPNSHLSEHYQSLVPQLHNLHSLYNVLKIAREKRGAMEFESQETRIVFGDDGKINRIEPIERNVAHRIIEECMLAANVATAKFLKKYKVPTLYRNHEAPPHDKLNDLKSFLNEMGLKLGGGHTPTPLDYARLMQTVQGRSDANVIQTVLLRSLSQAIYFPENLGHFGLAYSAYAHFTSPIRRYPDLLVHRQIRKVLNGTWEKELIKNKNPTKLEEAKNELINLGEHCSLTERRADEATRDVVRWLKCQYISKHIGEEFEALISGVTRFGFFAELKNIYIDGLVHVTSLHNDFYHFDNLHHRLVGEHTGQQHKLGDTVLIKVAKVNIEERKIDFEFIRNCSFTPKKTTKKTASKSNKPKAKSSSKSSNSLSRKRKKKDSNDKR
ncbi:MAG: vacB, partial [Francisellaceae bacterium]|nr:vacB [Francisellaceae bacterium]